MDTAGVGDISGETAPCPAPTCSSCISPPLSGPGCVGAWGGRGCGLHRLEQSSKETRLRVLHLSQVSVQMKKIYTTVYNLPLSPPSLLPSPTLPFSPFYLSSLLLSPTLPFSLLSPFPPALPTTAQLCIMPILKLENAVSEVILKIRLSPLFPYLFPAMLTSSDYDVYFPRFNPDGSRLVYFRAEAGGPHRTCAALMMVGKKRKYCDSKHFSPLRLSLSLSPSSPSLPSSLSSPQLLLLSLLPPFPSFPSLLFPLSLPPPLLRCSPSPLPPSPSSSF